MRILITLLFFVNAFSFAQKAPYFEGKLPFPVQNNEVFIAQLNKEGFKVNQGMVRLSYKEYMYLVRKYPQKSHFLGLDLRKGTLLTDDSTIYYQGVDQVRSTYGLLGDSATGRGVIIGIIDTGLDIQHGDFIDSLGNTRIVSMWDQSDNTSTSHVNTTFGYGAVWSEADINNDLPLQVDVNGHGTNVTGIAASNGLASGDMKGIAPEAKIVVVKSNFGLPNWTLTVADAVDYIYSIGDSLGMPVVINASLGTYLGSHDGRDLAAQRISAATNEKPGRSFVCASGNAGNQFFHLRHDINNDTAMTYFSKFYSAGLNKDIVWLQAWMNPGDASSMEFAFGLDPSLDNPVSSTPLEFVPIASLLGGSVVDTMKNSNDEQLGIVRYTVINEFERVSLTVYIEHLDSVDYLAKFITRGTGTLDIWSGGPTGVSTMIKDLGGREGLPAFENYVFPDTMQTIVSSWACHPELVTVGNLAKNLHFENVQGNVYSTIQPRHMALKEHSSKGPNRDGFVKPDVVAFGNNTMTSGSSIVMASRLASVPYAVYKDSMHIAQGGTSMASPAIAGIIALMYEKCPHLTNEEVMRKLRDLSVAESYYGQIPNNAYGYGMLKADVVLNGLEFIQPILGTHTFCEGDSVLVQPNLNHIVWKDQDTLPFYKVLTQDTVWGIGEDNYGCRGIIDTTVFTQVSTPTKPIIQMSNDTVYTSDDYEHYLWIVDGLSISNNINYYVVNGTESTLAVEVYNQNACKGVSDELTALSIEQEEMANFNFYPNPVKEVLKISSDQYLDELVQVYDIQGKKIKEIYFKGQELELSLSEFQAGIYLIEINHNRFKIIKE